MHSGNKKAEAVGYNIGSSRIAAWDMGFDFWAWENDPDYFAGQQKRFEAHISKPVLFAPEEMYQFEQTKLFD